MPLEMIFKSIHLRPRILHRIPGRLRIHIPVLRQITGDFQNITYSLLNDFTLPNGILSVNINFITGNILIEYEVNISSEKEILIWLADITKIADKIWSRFSYVKNGNKDKISANLIDYFAKLANNKQKLDKNINIPEYVWN